MYHYVPKHHGRLYTIVVILIFNPSVLQYLCIHGAEWYARGRAPFLPPTDRQTDRPMDPTDRPTHLRRDERRGHPLLAEVAQEAVGLVHRYRRNGAADLHLNALAVHELHGRDGIVQEHL